MYSLLSSCVLAAVAVTAAGHAASASRQQAGDPAASAIHVRPATWDEIGAIVERLSTSAPSDVRNVPAAERPARWRAWSEAQRRAVTARIAAGDLDSVVNVLLFGTSFTSQPRITAALLADLNRRWTSGDRSAQDTLTRAYRQRAADLVAAVAKNSADERMVFVRDLLRSNGHDVASAEGRGTAIEFLLEHVVRVRREAAALAKQLERVRTERDATTAFAERSKVFRDRGLSADSSVLTQFAIERALCALAERAVLSPRAIARIAIVGPGLDFADKQEGFDFYQPQSLQPFTIVDSLQRCGLAARDAAVTTIDVSDRVNGHLRGAIGRATRERAAYRLVLPWDSSGGWVDEATAYWKRAGDRIGKPFDTTTPALPGLRARGVAVRPDIVSRMTVVDANIVSDRLDVPDGARFDLVIATNVLVYYDTFEQTLALASIAAMLRPGGVLLTNDAVLEIPDVPLRSHGSLAVPFSTREGDGERMIWYVRAPR